MAKFPLTGFADEISPDLDVQISTLTRLNMTGLDLRSVGGVNVMDLSIDEVQRVRDRCAEHGLVVQCIGSPVNKVQFDVMVQARELERVRKACHLANVIHVRRVRLFTPEVPEERHDEFASAVIEWMSEQRRVAEDMGVTLIHENDWKFWGAYPKNAKRLLEELGGDHFKACFDFANTVLIGYKPLEDWFPWLLPYLDTIHIKDAKDGKVVAAGEGDGQMVETLRWLIGKGWNGPLTMEPHLQAAGSLGGFSGEQLFEVAVNALRDVVKAAGGEA